jgi:hypothetical protein
MRRAAKRDVEEEIIVGVLRRLGWSVLRISDKGAPDLLIGRDQTTLVLVEVKTGKGKLTPDQERFHAAWQGPAPLIFRSSDDAVAFHHDHVKGA